MYDPNASLTDKIKQEEFLKTKIYEAFNLFVNDKKGFLLNRFFYFYFQKNLYLKCFLLKINIFLNKLFYLLREVPYVMRYLGQFPSEA